MNRYIIILTTTEYEHSCRTMAAFLEASGLDPACGRTIVIGQDPDGALLPTPEGTLIRWDGHRTESVIDSLVPLCKEKLILFPYAEVCEELAVRLSVRLGGCSMTDVESLDPDAAVIRRKIYGGHIMGTFQLKKAPFCLSLAKGLPEAEPAGGRISEELRAQPTGGQLSEPHMTTQNDPLQVTDAVFHPEESSSGLANAKFVIAGGRGLRNKASAEELQRLAEIMGAATGGTRPVVMNAWLPLDRLIGVSGNMISPEICIVCGASGSPAFCAGIEHSRTILAINNDESAPIMKKADAFACADWKAVLSELAKLYV